MQKKSSISLIFIERRTLLSFLKALDSRKINIVDHNKNMNKQIETIRKKTLKQELFNKEEGYYWIRARQLFFTIAQVLFLLFLSFLFFFAPPTPPPLPPPPLFIPSSLSFLFLSSPISSSLLLLYLHQRKSNTPSFNP